MVAIVCLCYLGDVAGDCSNNSGGTSDNAGDMSEAKSQYESIRCNRLVMASSRWSNIIATVLNNNDEW